MLALTPTEVSAQSADARIDSLYPATPQVFVSDNAHMFTAAAIDSLNEMAAATQKQLGGDIAVITLPTLKGYQPYEVATRIGRQWKIGGMGPYGSDQRNLAVILLFVPKTATQRGICWIAPGLGAEGFITDTRAQRICTDVVLDSLKAGHFSGAAIAGVGAIRKLMYDHVHPAPPPPPTDWSAFFLTWGVCFGAIFVIGLIVFLIRVVMSRHRRVLDLEAAVADHESQIQQARALAQTSEREHEAALAAVRHDTGTSTIAWVVALLEAHPDDSTKVLIERIGNNGETLAETKARKAREAEERRIASLKADAVASFASSLLAAGMTEEAAQRAALLVPVPEGTSESDFRAALAVAITSWVAAVAEEKRRVAEAARRRKQEEEEDERRRAAAYTSSISSSGGYGSGSSSPGFGGGGGFSGGGGGASY